jgi:hypothetical protein
MISWRRMTAKNSKLKSSTVSRIETFYEGGGNEEMSSGLEFEANVK